MNLPKIFRESSVVDPDQYPDLDWIRFQWGLLIRIRNPDPDTGGQKVPEK
jgi:hypothetical protein